MFLNRFMGALFRVAFQFSAAMPGVLPDVRFQADETGPINLTVDPRQADFEGERLYRRMKGLSGVLKREVKWTISPDSNG